MGDVQVAHVDPHQETIDLRLWQGERARELDRVLGRQDEKGQRQRIGRPIHGHLLLLHGLKQRRLGLGCCAIDFVGEQHLRKNGTLTEFELLRVRTNRC